MLHIYFGLNKLNAPKNIYDCKFNFYNMGHSRKLFHVVLWVLILLLTPASAETELYYDDGSAEGSWNFEQAGNPSWATVDIGAARVRFVLSDFGISAPHKVNRVKVYFYPALAESSFKFGIVLRDVQTGYSTGIKGITSPNADQLKELIYTGSVQGGWAEYDVSSSDFASSDFYVEIVRESLVQYGDGLGVDNSAAKTPRSEVMQKGSWLNQVNNNMIRVILDEVQVQAMTPVATPTSVPTPAPYTQAQDPVVECISKYQKEKGLSYEEARTVCTTWSKTIEETHAVLPQEIPVIEIDRCGVIEKKLYYLIERLNSAQGQELESLKSDIELLKAELKMCEAKEEPVAVPLSVPPPKMETRSSCEEADVLKQTLEHLKKKTVYVEELVAKGEMEKSELEPHYKEYEYLSEKLETMNSACQQGETVEETPCVRLSKFETIYREINDKMEAAESDEIRIELKEKLTKILEEIAVLKQKCKIENLQGEQVESLYDFEKAYRLKQKMAVEATSGEDLLAELQEIEEAKRRLLEEFAQRMQELDARETTIIKKLEIKGGSVYLDNIKSKATKIKVDVNDRDIELEPSDSGTAIIDGDVQARGDIPLEYANGVLRSSKSGKEIKITPSELGNKISASLTALELVDDGTPEYLAKGEKKGRLLGIVQTSVVEEYRISAETGKIEDIDVPWWSILVSYT